MNPKIDEITIDGQIYVPKSQLQQEEKLDGMDYVIVRTYSAGVFAGYLKSKEGQIVTLRNARRLWYWEGAASLSQLAMEGVSKPGSCKFPCEVTEIELEQAIEIIIATDKAKKSIESVNIWKQ